MRKYICCINSGEEDEKMKMLILKKLRNKDRYYKTEYKHVRVGIYLIAYIYVESETT